MCIVDKNNMPTYVRPAGKKYTSTHLRTRFNAGGGLEHVSITSKTGKIPLSIYYLLYSLDLYNMEATCLVNIYIVSFFARFGLHLLVIGMESWNTS
jgi:hypothetical protein